MTVWWTCEHYGKCMGHIFFFALLLSIVHEYNSMETQVLNENARKPLSIGYLAFSLCSDILAALSVF